MNKIKITVVALATAGVGLVGVNTAFAGSAHTTPKAPAVAPAADSTSVKSAAAETPVTETPDGTESGASETGASDGNDGGHADPEGVDVNHEGGADEK